MTAAPSDFLAASHPDASAAPDVASPEAMSAAVHAKVGAARSSFFWAMRLLPKARREAMFAVYAFCREVDDIADEPAPLIEKQAGLAQWRAAIDTLYRGGTPPLVLAQALAGPIRDFDLQKPDFLAVVDGMEMDAVDDLAVMDEATLDLYCDRVASAVGRLSVRIFGPWQPRADDVATSLGRALQLTNILRDLDEDAGRGRLYLPKELLASHGLAGLAAGEVLRHPELPRLCETLAGRAQAAFDAADSAMADCAPSAMRPAAIMRDVYRTLLDRLIRRGWTDLRTRVRVSTAHKLWIALRRGVL